MIRSGLCFLLFWIFTVWRKRQVWPRTGAKLLLHRFTRYNQSPPALHLPLSPLTAVSPGTHSLGSGQVPGRRPRMYHRTSSPSFHGPYTVPSGLALITLMTVSHGYIPFPCHTHRSPLWRLCSRVCARSHPGWIGGCPLVGVSGSI